MLEDGTCHRKRNVSVMDRRKPGETPLCKCGSLMLVFLSLPDGLHMQVDHSLCPWKPPFPAPWASFGVLLSTHCLVLVFKQYLTSTTFSNTALNSGASAIKKRGTVFGSLAAPYGVSPCLISFALSQVSQLSMRMVSPG